MVSSLSLASYLAAGQGFESEPQASHQKAQKHKKDWLKVVEIRVVFVCLLFKLIVGEVLAGLQFKLGFLCFCKAAKFSSFGCGFRLAKSA